jgi:hypothetical protein
VGVKCQSCGTINDKAIGPCQGGCGRVFMAEAVRLAGARSGQSREFRLSTPIGRRLLELIAGDEAVYASEPQFEIIKNKAAGRWMIRHIPTAVHPTYYNGHPIEGEPVPIETGGAITIGPVRTKLNVALSP